MESKMVGFGYGVLNDPLEKQANEQGYTLGEKAEQLERRRESINILMFGDILTESQIDKAFQKLQKQVVKALRPLKEVKL